MRNFQLLFIWACCFVFGCAESTAVLDEDDDDTHDTAGDTDTDTDTDADTDTDTDTDADTDGDGDGDTDGDTDADSDGDADADGDSDADTDTDVSNGCPVYVDADVSAPGSGESWATAFKTIQEGADRATELNASGPCEVWVAEGAYYIYQATADDTLSVGTNVHLYGGFAGDETALDQRDWAARVTRIDGKGGALSVLKVKHVVTMVGSPFTGQAVLDGFVVTDGHAPSTEGVPDGRGGGIKGLYNLTDAVVRNCTVVDNYAGYSGGGIYCDGDLEVSNSFFSGNTSKWGAAIYASSVSRARIENSVFVENTVTNTGWGGGAVSLGGVIDSGPIIVNSTFYGNMTGSVDSTSGVHLNEPVILANNIFWENGGVLISGGDGDWATVIYNNVEGGLATPMVDAGGNINADPLFTSTTSPHDLHLQAGSPCIDAASGNYAPATDLEGNDRFDDPATTNTGTGSPDYADMGAYEYQG